MGAVAAKPQDESATHTTYAANGSNTWGGGGAGGPVGQYDWFNPTQPKSAEKSWYTQYRDEHGSLPVWDQNLGERYNSSTGYVDPNGDAAVGAWAAFDPNNKNTPQSPYADDPDAQSYFQFDRPAWAIDPSQQTAESGFGFSPWSDPRMSENFQAPGMLEQPPSPGAEQAYDMGNSNPSPALGSSSWGASPYLQSMNLYGSMGGQTQNFNTYDPRQNSAGFSYGKLGG